MLFLENGSSSMAGKMPCQFEARSPALDRLLVCDADNTYSLRTPQKRKGIRTDIVLLHLNSRSGMLL